MEFKDYLHNSTENVNEDSKSTESTEATQLNEYSKSQGYTGTADMIYRLGKLLDPSSNLSKGISKSMGEGYKKDFYKMKKLIDQISDIWDDIDRDIDMGNN